MDGEGLEWGEPPSVLPSQGAERLSELCGRAGSLDCGPQDFVDGLIRLAPLQAVRLCLAGASRSFVSMAESVELAADPSHESAGGLDTAGWWADRLDAVCQQVRAVEPGSQPSSVHLLWGSAEQREVLGEALTPALQRSLQRFVGWRERLRYPLLEAAWKNGEAALAEVDIEGRVLAANPAGKKLFGWGESPGRLPIDLQQGLLGLEVSSRGPTIMLWEDPATDCHEVAVSRVEGSPDSLLLEIQKSSAHFLVRLERAVERCGFTARESEVLALVAAGLSNRQIADYVGVSEATVKFHLVSLMRKSGAPSRTALLASLDLWGLVGGRTGLDTLPQSSSPLRVLKTSLSVLQLLPEGIVRYPLPEGASFDEFHVQEMADGVRELMGGEPVGLLLDAPRYVSSTPAARRLAGREDLWEHVSACAIRVGSPVSIMLGNLFLKLERPVVQTRFFSREGSAFSWLQDVAS